MKSLIKSIGFSLIASTFLFGASGNTDSYVLKRAINMSNSLIMDNKYIRAGVSDDGTFGVGGNTKPGFELDPKGDGNYTWVIDGSEVVPDYLTPGKPFEGFTIKFIEKSSDDTNITITKINENSSDTDITDTNISIAAKFSDGNISSVLHKAVIKDSDGNPIMEIKQVYKLDPESTALNIQVYLTNVSDKTLYDVRYARYLDPDPDVNAYGSYSTKNQLGLNIILGDSNITIPATNIAYALGEKTGMPVGIFTFDDTYEHNAVISPRWTKDPDVILRGGCDGDGDLNATGCSYGDYTIGLAFDIENLKPGETKVINLGYLFGTSLKTAIESSTKAVLDKTYIDSLALGWHLIGTSDAILDMSIFENVDIVWVYNDGEWKWYTEKDEYLPLLKKSGFTKLSSIKPLSGVWVYKKEITLPTISEETISEETNTTVEDTNTTESSVTLTEEDFKDKTIVLRDSDGEDVILKLWADNHGTLTYYDDGKKVVENISWTFDDTDNTLIVRSSDTGATYYARFDGPLAADTDVYVKGPGFEEVDIVKSVEGI